MRLSPDTRNPLSPKTVLFRCKDGPCQRGQAILESTLCMLFVLFLVLFGLLQVYHLAIANLFSDYSAVVAARSSSVGFADYLVERIGRCAAIGASGRLSNPPNNDSNSPLALYQVEKGLIPRYIQGVEWIDYEYWDGDRYNFSHKSGSDSTAGSAGEEVPRTTIGIQQSPNGSTGTTTATAVFNDYPLVLMAGKHYPLRYWFGGSNKLNLQSQATDVNYAHIYLNENR